MAGTEGTQSPSPNTEGAPGGRPAWVIPLLVVLTLAAIAATVLAVLAAQDDDGDDVATTTPSSSSTTVTDSSTTTTVADSSTTTVADTSTSAPGDTTTSTPGDTTSTTEADGPTVQLTTSADLDETFDVTACENVGETSLTLEAVTDDPDDPILLVLDAADGTGTILLSGSQEAEGTVDELTVGDTGEIDASGTIGAPDAEETDTFELTGTCP
ncbi:MAG: hypothetical protein S0880_18705 [Actinomycetota bacterium]|nr:hypothetical protein [Actinomycetota bacterium]